MSANAIRRSVGLRSVLRIGSAIDGLTLRAEGPDANATISRRLAIGAAGRRISTVGAARETDIGSAGGRCWLSLVATAAAPAGAGGRVLGPVAGAGREGAAGRAGAAGLALGPAGLDMTALRGAGPIAVAAPGTGAFRGDGPATTGRAAAPEGGGGAARVACAFIRA